jgi:hypothetical protein
MLTNLNFSVDISELRQYYNTVVTKFDHLMWSWDRYSDTIVEQWSSIAYSDPDNLKTYGWAIQSNLEDLSIPCPPWNISKHKTVDYRNTELVFGIIERLQTAIPFGYRWSISVQPPGGKVSLHADQEDEATVWLPIYTDGVAITFVNDEITTEYELVSNGSVYLLDTTIPHFTYNSSNKDRVSIIIRLPKSKISELIKIKGTL